MRLGALVKRAGHGQSSVVDVANLRSTDESGENKEREKKGERMSHGPVGVQGTVRHAPVEASVEG